MEWVSEKVEYRSYTMLRSHRLRRRLLCDAGLQPKVAKTAPAQAKRI